jgi:hypothetical protein
MLESNHNKQINSERIKIDKLNEDISRLHGLYRMKLNLQKVKYEKELEELKQSLTSNKDLWDKLSISERNEGILKEELTKTQKSLASAEEFIKKLQLQIRKSHDKNVSLEKQLSAMTTHEILKNSSTIEFKEMELYKQTKRTYIYNMNNNISLLSAVDAVKSKYPDDKNVLTVLENFELLNQKYADEIDSKRNMVSKLNEIKKDIERMKDLENKKIVELNNQITELIEENRKLKIQLVKSTTKVNIPEMSSMQENEKFTQTSYPKINYDKNNIQASNKSLPGFSNLSQSQDRAKLIKIGQSIIYGGKDNKI